MKKIFYFALVLFIMSAVAACNQKSQAPSDKKQEFKDGLTEQDTAQMLKLSDDCMELLKKKDVDGALAMLNEYDDSTGTVQPLSEQTRAKYLRLFKMFPVYKYTLSSYSFMLEGLNDVKYDIIFAEEEHPEVNGVPKTSFMFNPVKVDGQWYLTVKRADQSIDRVQ